MKFTVHRDNLRKALTNVSRAIPGKTSMPVLANIHCSVVSDAMIAFAATNLEVGITCFIPATVQQAGEITIPGKISVDLINNLPSEAVHVSVDATTINMKCGRFDNTLMGLGASDFPTLPSVDAAPIELPRTFIDAIDHVLSAAAADDSRPVLTAIRIVIEGNTVQMASADGFRLAQTTVQIPDAAPERIEVLIPAKTMGEVLNIMGGQSDETIKMRVNSTSVVFVSSQFQIISRVVDGKYPDIARVIPTEFQSQFVFDIDEMRRAAKIASLLDSKAGVKLMISERSIALLSRGNDLGTAHGTIDGVHDGIDHDITLNVKYLQDALTALQAAGGNKAVLKTNSNQSPAIFQPVDNRDYLHVVMPLMVR